MAARSAGKSVIEATSAFGTSVPFFRGPRMALTDGAPRAGCSSTDVVSEYTYPAVSAESVKVLYQEPQRPYEVIAFMHKVSRIEHPGSGDVASLREDAAK